MEERAVAPFGDGIDGAGDEAATPTSRAERRLRLLVVGALGALAVAMVSHTVNGIWAFDIWAHVAAVREFADKGLDPAHPLVTGTDGDPMLNPYTLAWGLVAGALDLEALTVLRVAAVVNLVALGAALFAVARRFSDERGAGPLLVLLTLFAWGIGPWRWAGFYNLNSLGTVLPLVSTFATAVGLFALASLHDSLGGGASRARLAVVAVGLPLTFLVHPMTGAWVTLLGAGLVLGRPRVLDRRLAVVAVGVGVGGLASLAWPYFPVLELFGGSRDYDATNLAMFEHVVVRTFAALPGIAVLAHRLARGRRDPLAIGTALVLAVYLLAWATGRAAVGRVLPGAVLGAHLALVQVLPGWLRTAAGRLDRRRLALVAVVLAACGASMAPGAVRSVPRALLPGSLADDDRLRSIVEPFEVLPGPIDRDDTILATQELALGAAASSGKAIAIEVPQPFVDDIDERRRREAELRAVLDDPATAGPLLADAGVEWLVVAPAEAAPWAGVAEEVLRGEELVVLRLRE